MAAVSVKRSIGEILSAELDASTSAKVHAWQSSNIMRPSGYQVGKSATKFDSRKKEALPY